MKIDHKLSNRDQIFGRYSHGYEKYISRSSAIIERPPNELVANWSGHATPTRSGVLSWVRIFSPTLFSEMLVTGSYDDYQTALPEFSSAGNLAKQLGLPNPFNVSGLPDITGTGFGLGYTGIRPAENITQYIAVEENLTKIHGRHEFQFGGRIRQEVLDNLTDQAQTQGAHTFNNLATAAYDPASGTAYSALPYTGHAAASLYMGLAASYSAKLQRDWFNFRTWESAFYFQDNFKVTSRLTLNLGLRWQIQPFLREANNLMSGFDPKTKSIVNGNTIEEMISRGTTVPSVVSLYTRLGVKFTTPEQAGLPKNFANSNLRDLFPRLGFAYRFGSGNRMVLRGGYSQFGSPIPLRSMYVRLAANAPLTSVFTADANSAAQSPDGRANYSLRSVPTVVAGVNSANVIDINSPNSVSRGGFATSYLNPNLPTTRVHEWNVTLEREIMKDTVLRASYVGNHASNLEQWYSYNPSPNDYVWYTGTGLPLPTGEYAGVAKRPFDQTTYGDISEMRKSAYSNFSGAQVGIERRFSAGLGFQMFYIMSNALSMVGIDNTSENVYLPGAVPTDFDDRNRFLNYQRDNSGSYAHFTIPKHRVRWNWIADLPFGKGKRFAGNAGGVLDRIVGGWQVGGNATWRTNYWSLPTTNWGYLGNVETYGKKYPIEDCRSGTCYQGYLYYNGYIPANRINSVDSKGKPNGVMGVPQGYKPSNSPVWPVAANGGDPADPNYGYRDTNTVFVTLKNGSRVSTAMNTNLHPWRNQLVRGFASVFMDANMFKTVRITERFSLRLSMDAFFALNNPGLGLPDANGIVSTRTNVNSNEPRAMQASLRLIW